MKSILYIALPAEPDGPFQIAREKGGRLEVIHHRGPFGATGCVAFAPATAVGHFRVPVPARNEAEASRAALYAIEDELAQPVEEIHIVLGPKSRNATDRDIYVVDRSLMMSWIALLSKAGLSPESIIPEQCLFTDIDHPVDLGDRIIQRQGDRIVGIETALPGHAGEEVPKSPETFDIEDGINLIRLVERSATRPGVNLRAGQFALEKSRKQGVSTWRKAAGISVAAVSVWTGTLILEAHNYNFAIEKLNEQATERYTRIFPGSAIPADLDRTTRDMLAVSTTPDKLEFRTTVAAIYEAVELNPGTQISALVFDSENSRLSVTLILPVPDTAATIVAFLQSRGFQVSSAVPAGSDQNAMSREIILEPIP